jgi:small subunit ribosomal protein S14
MSSKGVLIKSFKQIKEVKNKELNIRKKKLLTNSSISHIYKQPSNFIKSKKGSITRVNLRCLYTGRKKGLVRKTKMTRMYFKVTAFKGLIPGLRKSSW